jgi:4-alpha-glucanotransferase
VPTDRWGIDDEYHDALGTEHAVTDETYAAVLGAMGVTDGADGPPPEADTAVRLLAPGPGPGSRRALDGPAEIALEDGTTYTVDGELPADLPPGYHKLRMRDAPRSRASGDTLLIVSPGHCHLPADLRTWGWAAQVYAARSRASWGIGDLADLARLGRWTRSLGGGVVMVNPFSAATPLLPLEPSPYYPSSRRFRNPLFVSVEAVAGFDALGPDRERLSAAGRALSAERRIDRDAIFRIKMEALEKIFAIQERRGRDPAFEAYWSEQGESLKQFAIHCALAEVHGRDWRSWPAGYRHPHRPEVQAFEFERASRVRFHAWLQWLVDVQLAAAAREITVVNDLPIGLDVAGADAWCWQELLADGVSVGAPPDEFNSAGQDWGLTPFVPWRLRAAFYQPFIETIRAMLRHAGGLRIDHVMGLFRLFWIPRGLGAKNGTYVRTRADELMAIVAIESQRAGAFIVGEDLGTVEPGVRERLAEHRMLSYRLLYFEPTPPDEFPELALSSVTTHDLPTVAGLWTGSDLVAQKRIGLRTNDAGTRALRAKLAETADLPDDAPVEDAVEATHRALGAAPSRILLATLDDAIAVPERPNMPGTVTEWPNWSLALPKTLEEIEEADLPRRVARALARD